jgi:hypothetical protein
MKLTVLLAAVAAIACGQGGAGFGRMNGAGAVPGGGPSLGGAGFGRYIYPGTGAPAAVRTGPRGGGFVAPPPQSHPQGHGRSVIVPYPVFYGASYYPYDAPPPVDLTALPPDYGQYPQSPVVIINQNFKPDVANPVLRDYSNVPLPEPVAPPPPQAYERPRIVNNDDSTPTIYLVAMKDKSIFASVAYWVDGETLNYVTREGSINHVSLDLVDREFSKQLNDERGVEFKLPAAR